MAAGLERPLRDVVVGLVNREVDHDVDLVVGQEVVDGPVDPAAVSLAERRRPGGIEIGGRHEADPRMGRDVPGVAARDVPGTDDPDAK
jgi:hypothetical protein